MLRPMSRFASIREAKEYLGGKIVAQAQQDHVPLSDVERKMLYFSETGWTLPDMMAVNQAFDETYDQDAYEAKIGQIVQRIHQQPGAELDNDWDEAVGRLLKEDHYLSVLIRGAGSESTDLSSWDVIKLILAGAVVVTLYLPIMFWVFSHVSNPTISKLISAALLMALVIPAVYLANRLPRKSA